MSYVIITTYKFYGNTKDAVRTFIRRGLNAWMSKQGNLAVEVPMSAETAMQNYAANLGEGNDPDELAERFKNAINDYLRGRCY